MQAILSAADDAAIPVHPVLLLTDQPTAPAIAIAKEAGLKVEVLRYRDFDSREAFGEKALEILRHHEVDGVALAGFMRILPENVIEGFEGMIFNIHPSLLPAFPGLNAVRQALDYGVRIAGCTVHLVDQGVDTGPIVLQAAVWVQQEDDEDTLAARILEWEHQIYPKALRLWAKDQLEVEGRKVWIRDDEG